MQGTHIQVVTADKEIFQGVRGFLSLALMDLLNREGFLMVGGIIVRGINDFRGGGKD